jgi:multimeric flavodoxin WrbA
MNIGHCSGCGDCSAEGKCSISDDMDIIYRAFKENDLIVLATPIHFSGPSSVIKTVIDRFQPFWFMNGKHPLFSAALMSGGNPTPNFKNTASIFRAFSITAGIKWLGSLEIPCTDKKTTPDVSLQSLNYGKEIGSVMIKDQLLSL